MNIEETKEAIAVMQAFVDGEAIQYTSPWPVQWTNFLRGENPSWDWTECHYRVKPEPKEMWVNEYANGETYVYAEEKLARSGAQAANGSGVGIGVTRVAVRYREVIEE